MAETARVAIRLTLEGSSHVARAVGSITGGIGRMSRGISQGAASLYHFGQIARGVYATASKIAGMAGRATNALLAPNEAFEVSVLQFEQLLGTADKARDHIQELYSYANSTPFLNPDVVKGGKVLYNIAGATLGAGKGLKMVGDMAAFADMTLTEMSQPLSRLYSMISSGNAFGEEARRLMELGLLTGKQRDELVAMQKAGEDGAAVWARLTEFMKKYDGMAGKVSNTMKGAKSTIAGLWGEIKRLSGVKLFDAVKTDIIGIRDDMSEAFETGRISVFVDKASEGIAKVYEQVRDAALGGLTANDILSAAEQGELGKLFTEIMKGAGEDFGAAIANAADKYGPSIQRAIIPQKLHGILGLKDQKVFKGMLEGTAQFKDLGLWQQIRGGFAAATMPQTFLSDPETFARAFAESNVRSSTPRSLGHTAARVAAHAWGDHGAASYATGTPVYTESDPIWVAVSNTVTSNAVLGAAARVAALDLGGSGQMYPEPIGPMTLDQYVRSDAPAGDVNHVMQQVADDVLRNMQRIANATEAAAQRAESAVF